MKSSVSIFIIKHFYLYECIYFMFCVLSYHLLNLLLEFPITKKGPKFMETFIFLLVVCLCLFACLCVFCLIVTSCLIVT